MQALTYYIALLFIYGLDTYSIPILLWGERCGIPAAVPRIGLSQKDRDAESAQCFSREE